MDCVVLGLSGIKQQVLGILELSVLSREGCKCPQCMRIKNSGLGQGPGLTQPCSLHLPSPVHEFVVAEWAQLCV